ncbi:MAG: DUF4280 domain-containing protein [Campylobacteraceae bacterium]|nr:DUF4280 domain-containing protein [Campylobacteraceae bacterium]
MGQMVCTGALMKCTFGITPSALMVLPVNRVLACNMPAANIMDNKPLMNILPFGMCQSPSNPMVIAATAAAMGVLTPMPCIPNTVAPWTPGNPKTLIASMPAINNSSKLTCLWGGLIAINFAGQVTVQT